MRSHKLVPTSPSKNSKKQEGPQLSGAYIRSLVKQLSSSSSTARSEEIMSTKLPHDNHQPQHKDQQRQQQENDQQQPQKKQVRRRLHTSRPYQERLLNMAEARREIVTALKIHRATMRQAKEQQQQQEQLLQLQQQQHEEVQSQATMVNYDYLYNSSLAHFTHPSMSSYDHTPFATMVNSDHGLDHSLVSLPARPLGLNLSLQDFNGFAADDAKISASDASNSSFDPPFIQWPSPASSYSAYSSPTMSAAAVAATENAASSSLHRVLDNEEMAAIYSIGERHDIEWSDTVNLVTSAWWSRLLESVDGGGGRTEAGGTMNMPEWLCHSQLEAKESNLDSMAIPMAEYYHHGSYSEEDVALPRMDSGEIEGWDEEWFS